MIEIRNPADEVTYCSSFMIDLPVDRDNVVELAASASRRRSFLANKPGISSDYSRRPLEAWH